MNWKTDYRSFYYQNAEEPEDIVLAPDQTALLVIDIQNTYLTPDDDPDEAARWQPFYQRMNEQVIPRTAQLIADARQRGVETIFARIACLKDDGRDRSLSQKIDELQARRAAERASDHSQLLKQGLLGSIPT